jgi:hypothetical protein
VHKLGSTAHAQLPRHAQVMNAVFFFTLKARKNGCNGGVNTSMTKFYENNATGLPYEMTD